MKNLFITLILISAPTAWSLENVPDVWCTLAYYQRAAHWEDDLDLVTREFPVPTHGISDELKGFRTDARLISVCAEGLVEPCREEYHLRLRLSKNESATEAVSAVTPSAGPWSLNLKSGRFEEATLRCQLVGK